MKLPVQLWHIGNDADGAEQVLQASTFGTELHEFRLQPNETVMVRDAKDTDYLIVACRQQVEPERIIAVLENMLKLVNDLMPGVKNIALPDYALLNDAPIAARKLVKEIRNS